MIKWWWRRRQAEQDREIDRRKAELYDDIRAWVYDRMREHTVVGCREAVVPEWLFDLYEISSFPEGRWTSTHLEELGIDNLMFKGVAVSPPRKR